MSRSHSRANAQGHAEGHAEGHAQGHAQGYAQGYAQAAKAYRSGIAASSSSLRTLALLYDMMIANLLKARDGRERGELDISFNALGEASQIALVLPTTLDRARAGKLAETLERFYLGLSCRIIRLSHRQQPLARFDAMIEELRGVRATWQEVARLAAETAGGSPAALRKLKAEAESLPPGVHA